MAEKEIELPAVRVPGQLEQRMLERMERDHATGKERGFFFDEEEAARSVLFFEKYCVLWEGEWAGKPFVLSPFQRVNTREMYGWKREGSGHRRFLESYWEIARKNGKTSYAGAAGLKGLVQDNEQGAQCWFTATKRDQAMIGFKAAAEMALQSPKLLRYVKVPKGYPRGSPITCPRLLGRLSVLSSDHSTQDGLNPSTDIRDEIHEWKDRRLAAKLDTAKGGRRQPFTLEITTAGVYDPTAYGWQRHAYALNVLNGIEEDDSLFAYVAAADEGDDPYDPATWWKANPGLGVVTAPRVPGGARAEGPEATGLLQRLPALPPQRLDEAGPTLAPPGGLAGVRRHADRPRAAARPAVLGRPRPLPEARPHEPRAVVPGGGWRRDGAGPLLDPGGPGGRQGWDDGGEEFVPDLGPAGVAHRRPLATSSTMPGCGTR